MENLANNNSSSMNASGNQNMFSTVNLGHQSSSVGHDIPQGGPMNSLLHRTEELNIRGVGSSSQVSARSFTGLVREQHYSLLHGGSLVVELNIEGPRGANNNVVPSDVRGAAAQNDSLQDDRGQRCACGRKRKAGPESPEDPNSINIDLNEIPTDADEEEYCDCENPPVQVTENTTQQSQSSLGGDQTENQGSNTGGRSRRSRRRGTPRRFEASETETGGSSSGIQILEPPIIPPVIVVTSSRRAVNEIDIGGPPFRIQDMVTTRSDDLVHTLFQPPTFGPLQRATTQLVDQHHHHQSTGGTSGLNQGQFVGPMIRFAGANSRDPRLNFQSIGNIMQQQGVLDSNLQRELMRLHRNATVADFNDAANDQFDGMRMDIEEMTYEQLLALEEDIGAVNTGLTEEVIMERLMRRYYRAPKNKTSEVAESCSICLVDFENRDVLGKIDCTHKFHFDCIKQWLKVKNFCPICKETALPQN